MLFFTITTINASLLWRYMSISYHGEGGHCEQDRVGEIPPGRKLRDNFSDLKPTWVPRLGTWVLRLEAYLGSQRPSVPLNLWLDAMSTRKAASWGWLFPQKNASQNTQDTQIRDLVWLALYMFSSASFWYLSLTYLNKFFEIDSICWWLFCPYLMHKFRFRSELLFLNWPDGYKHTLGRSNPRLHKHWKMSDSQCTGWKEITNHHIYNI